MAQRTTNTPTPDPAPSKRRTASYGRMVRGVVLWNALWWTLLVLVARPWTFGGWATVAAVATFAALSVAVPLAVFARAMAGRLYPGAATRLLVYRPFWYLQLMVPLIAAAGVLGALAGLAVGAAGPGSAWSTAWAIGRWTAAGTAAVLGVIAVAGWAGSRRLVTRRLAAVFPDLPPGLEGLRIVQLSDLHVGPHTSRRHLARVVEAIQRAQPDVIVFTGDQVDDHARDTEPFARAFAGLDAPLGVFAVAGNHDVYAGWDATREGLEAAGQRVLVNEAVELRRGVAPLAASRQADGNSVEPGTAMSPAHAANPGNAEAAHRASLWLAGTGDPAAGSVRSASPDAAPDLDATLAGVPADAFVVVLAHNPVLWPALAERGVPLTLSGHTHHGQLSVPHLSWSLAGVFLEHDMGSYEREGSLLYINPGTNYWGLPFRLGALPEVTVVELARGEAPALVVRD